jgi:O-acetyl-ADP-ribose deacetylase (regulator of RNase III)
MGNYKEVFGDLIELAKRGQFDVIGHGCNCFCAMSAGIAPQMAVAFGCNKFPMEDKSTSGDINKLGQVDWTVLTIAVGNGDFDVLDHDLAVVNIYSQYTPNVALKPLDYEALTLGLRKINHLFKGKRVGLPLIGAGLAGGEWSRIKEIIQTELKDCEITIVKWSGPKNY